MLEFLPPEWSQKITLDGFGVPKIRARETNEGRDCSITLDGRFGMDIPAEYASQVIWLMANAMAIGAGYSCHGEHSQPVNPFKVRVSEVEFVRKDNGND